MSAFAGSTSAKLLMSKQLEYFKYFKPIVFTMQKQPPVFIRHKPICLKKQKNIPPQNLFHRTTFPNIPTKNVIIQWEPLEADVKVQIQCLGVQVVDPAAYISRYGPSLVDSSRLPAQANKFKAPNGHRLAKDGCSDDLPILTGDVHALKLIDLNSHGLSAYRSQLCK